MQLRIKSSAKDRLKIAAAVAALDLEVHRKEVLLYNYQVIIANSQSA